MEVGNKTKEKKAGTDVAPPPPRPRLRRALSSSAAVAGVKLAAMAMGLNVRPRTADMPPTMQERAFRCARALIDDARRPNPTLLALALKKEFDEMYGPAWHCVVGKSFGSFVTHSTGGFLYFTLEEVDEDCNGNSDRGQLSVLLFQTRLRRV